uniref:F-box domain-containing protein n=1 Tax=Mycena chlorophos TaxID=658473 RepID=A0ABQ0LDA1_MYCCL|nr:predicted protein [Mycena chlorophos]
MSQPRLPPELEREIFETAAILHPRTVPALIATAHRVQEWTEPMLYRVVRFKLGSPQTEALLQAIRTKPPHFIERSVRHIFFEADGPMSYMVPPEVGLQVLQKCTGIVDFGTTRCFTGKAVLDALGALPNLRALTVNLSSLFQLEWRGNSGTLPLALKHITHLTILDLYLLHIVEFLSGLPNITHFSMKLSVDHGGSPFLKSDTISNILLSCRHLQVLLLTTTKSPFPTIYPDGPPSSDPRLVFAHRENEYRGFWSGWLACANGKRDEDPWALADAVVSARRSSNTPWEPMTSEWVPPPVPEPAQAFSSPSDSTYLERGYC